MSTSDFESAYLAKGGFGGHRASALCSPQHSIFSNITFQIIQSDFTFVRVYSTPDNLCFCCGTLVGLHDNFWTDLEYFRFSNIATIQVRI